jgi:glyoxylase-like metal-dependent hydrolase (beta-lactamase superfamily II)
VIRDLAEGLWIWRTPLPGWQPERGYPKDVTSTCVRSGREIAVLDAIEPGDDEVWRRLDREPPTLVVVLKPDHVRDVDAFVRRYRARAFGPWLFWRGDVPETELEPIEPGSELPGDIVALYDGRGRNETPVWLPEQRTLVFADALVGAEEGLRIWDTPHIARARPALRELLELPFERVIVSHGEPVHDRAAFERALDLPVWSGELSG